MVKLRLTRTGKKHEPHYRIIAVDSRKKRDGAFIEILGYYNPRTKPSTLKLEKELVTKWLNDGAQPSETVKALLKKEGLLKEKKPEKKDTRKATKKSTKKVEVKATKGKAKPAKKASTKTKK